MTGASRRVQAENVVDSTRRIPLDEPAFGRHLPERLQGSNHGGMRLPRLFRRHAKVLWNAVRVQAFDKRHKVNRGRC